MQLPIYFIIIVTVISYLFGTFPSASIITKAFSGKDIHASGTGNAGAMNTYEVTGKRYAGVLVFLLDVIKGAVAVFVARLITDNDIFAAGLSAAWVVMGHNYNIFKKYKGGRGLAAAVGAFLMINPLLIIMWCLMWVTGYFIIKKDVHVANAIGCVGGAIMIFSSPDPLINIMQFVPQESTMDYKIIGAVVCLIILLRHIKPLQELFREKN